MNTLHPFSRMMRVIDAMDDQQQCKLFIDLCGFAVGVRDVLGLFQPGLDRDVMGRVNQDMRNLLTAVSLDIKEQEGDSGRALN